MFPGRRNVKLCESSGNLRTSSGHDHHDVCVASEHVNVGSKLGITNLHAPKLRLRFGATDLKLLDDIRDALEAMAIVVLSSVTKQK